ncbi:hypothetical protein ZWY2020_041978 [Hordeum vulgare]|nr:hypothetical protein ZWY2020_041978 [Hordeum vulgare]
MHGAMALRGDLTMLDFLMLPPSSASRHTNDSASRSLAAGPPVALLGLVNHGGARLLLLQPPPTGPTPLGRDRWAELHNAFIAACLIAYFPNVPDLAIYNLDPLHLTSLVPCWLLIPRSTPSISPVGPISSSCARLTPQSTRSTSQNCTAGRKMSC